MKTPKPHVELESHGPWFSDSSPQAKVVATALSPGGTITAPNAEERWPTLV